MENVDLSKRMLEYRARNRLSMRNAANRCGVSVQTWMYVERGLQQASPLTETKIMLLINSENGKEDNG